MRPRPKNLLLLQPPLTRFQGIDLTHYLIGKNNVFAFLRRKVCFRVITINQECRAVIREGCFPLGGKMSKDKAIHLIRLRFDQPIIFFIKKPTPFPRLSYRVAVSLWHWSTTWVWTPLSIPIVKS